MDSSAQLTDLPVGFLAQAAPNSRHSFARPGTQHFRYMQDGVLARILHDLDAPALSTAEWVCWRFRKLGEHTQLHCGLEYPRLRVSQRKM